MQTDALDDFLFFLVLLEGVASLVCTYDLILLSLHGGYSDRLVPHLVAFAIVAALLMLTSLVADLRQRPRRSSGGQRPG